MARMTASSSLTAECSPSTSATKRSGPSFYPPAKWDQVTTSPTRTTPRAGT